MNQGSNLVYKNISFGLNKQYFGISLQHLKSRTVDIGIWLGFVSENTEDLKTVGHNILNGPNSGPPFTCAHLAPRPLKQSLSPVERIRAHWCLPVLVPQTQHVISTELNNGSLRILFKQKQVHLFQPIRLQLSP